FERGLSGVALAVFVVVLFFFGSAEDGDVVIVLGFEDLGRARTELRTRALFVVFPNRRLFVVFFRNRRLGGRTERRFFFFVALRALRQARQIDLDVLGDFERRSAIGKTLFDGLLIPLAERENPWFYPYQRVFFFVLFDERREPCAHRHLRALAHVREEVLLD